MSITGTDITKKISFLFESQPEKIVELNDDPSGYKDYDLYIKSGTNYLLYKKKGSSFKKFTKDYERVIDKFYILKQDRLNKIKQDQKKLNQRLLNIDLDRPEEIREIFVDMINISFKLPLDKQIIEGTHESVGIVIEYCFSKPEIITQVLSISSKDYTTAIHSVGVMFLCIAYAIHNIKFQKRIKNFGLMGLFHDIGKLYIDDTILKAPRKLTSQEFETIKNHPKWSYDILVKMDYADDITLPALEHHEKIDGTGYPDNKTGDLLHPFSKILSIMDMYEAITNIRPYKPFINPLEALNIIAGDVKKGKLDSTAFKNFAKSIIGISY